MDILTTILSSHWAIQQSYAEAAYPMIEKLISGQPWEGPTIESGWAIAEGEAKKGYESFEDMPSGSIAVFNLKGPMMKDDQYCGPRGTAWLASQIQEADRAENIAGIILDIDSPGGQVSGTEHLSNVISTTDKPIHSLVDRACSAAYWSGSHADKVWMSAKSSMVGSIGVMCSFTDMTKAWKARGVQFHEVYSTLSPNKNKSFRNALKGKYSLMEEELTDIDKIFMQAIREHRKGVSEDALDGSVFLAESAIQLGLADEIGGMSEIVAAIRGGKQYSFNNQTTMSMKNKGALGRFMSVFSKDEDVEELNNDIEALRESEANAVKRVEGLEAQLAIKDSRISELADQNTALAESLATAEQEREAAQELAEKFGAQPGAMPTAPEKKGTEGASQESQLPAGFDPNSEHNRIAREALGY